MNYCETLERIGEAGLIPVVKLEKPEQAAPLASSLYRAGISCMEVTFRTESCIPAIKEICREVPQMLVGAGTVVREEQAKEAAEAGAKFLVSPGWDRRTAEGCMKRGFTLIPGCATPGEIQQAADMGFKAVKLFPAERLGGVSYLKLLSEVYAGIRFMPTGGIREENFSEYLRLPSVLACGGSFVVPHELLDSGKFDKIGEIAARAVKRMFGFEIAHVGINCKNGEEAAMAAGSLKDWFFFEPRENPSSIFTDTSVEIMKQPYLGTHGHIAIATDCPERAKKFLERKGVRFIEESAVYRPGGELQAVYFEEEVGGFAVHLVRRA